MMLGYETTTRKFGASPFFANAQHEQREAALEEMLKLAERPEKSVREVGTGRVFSSTKH